MSIAADSGRPPPALPEKTDEPAVAQALAQALVAALRHGGREEGTALDPGRLLHLVPAAVYLCDAAGRITFFNRQAAELWNRQPRLNHDGEKYCGWARALRSDGSELPADMLPVAEALRANRSVRDLEIQVERPDGARFHVSLNIDVLPDAGGRPAGTITVFRDITPRKRVELHLQWQRDLMEQIVQGAPLPQILESLTVAIEELCPRRSAVAILLREVDGGDFRPVAGGRCPEAWMKALARAGLAMESASPLRGERTIAADIAQNPAWAGWRDEAGRHGFRACWTNPIAAFDGTLLGAFAICYFTPGAPSAADIEMVEVLTRTAVIAIERRGVSQALHESESRFGAIVNQAATGIVECALDGRIVLCNQRFCDMVGYRVAELMGRPILDLTHPDDVAASRETGRRLREGGPDSVLEKRYLHKGGSFVWATSSFGAVRDETGKVRSIVAMIMETGDRRRAARDAEFLDHLSRDLAPLSDPDEIVRRACAAVGGHLGVHRCYLPEWQDDRLHVTVRQDWHAPGATALAGTYNVDNFGPPSLRARMQEGRVAVIDVEREPDLRDFLPSYRRLNVRSFATARVIRGDRSAAIMTVTSDIPRVWTNAELALLEHAVARVWPLVERARVGAAVRAAARRLMLAMKIGRLGDWTWDAATNSVTLSGAPAEIIGVPDGTTLSRADLRAYLHPDDIEPARRIVQEAMDARRDYQMEYRLRRPSGDYAWMAVQGAGVFAPDGTLVSVVGVMQEITDRKQAEERLRAHEMQLRFISSNAPTILSHLDRDGRFLFVNKAFAERWKSSPDALVGRTIAEVAGPAALAAVQSHIDRVLQGETVEFEGVVQYEALGRRYMKATYAPDIGPDGRVRGWLSAAHDLTDRWRAEQALRESEEQVRLATRAGKIGIWNWDIPANRIAWTESLYEIHGVKPGEFEPTLQGFALLIHPEDRAPVQRAIQSALEHGAPYELEFRIVRPVGGTIWVFANGSVVRDGEGRAVRMMGATLDITARKAAELALRESEGRFRALASHAPVGIFLTDTNGESVFANESWRAMAGLTAEQARGAGWLQALHPDDRGRVAAEWAGAVRDCRRFVSEFRFRRPDGTVVWIEASAVEFRNAHGGRQGYIGTMVDRTERKLAEDALRESEKRFRTLASHAPVGIFLTDPAGATLLVNESWTEMTGLSLAEARGDGWVRAIHPEDRARVRAEWEAAVRDGASSVAEYRFLHADGRVTWVQGRAVQLHDEAGRPAGYIGTIADFTARKRVEEKLREGEERFRTLADNIAQFAWMNDAAGRRQWINQRFLDYTGLTAEQVERGEALALHHPDHRDRVIRKYERHIALGEPWEDIFPLRGRDGQYRWFLSRAIPIRNAEGRVTRWFGTNTDVTQLRETEAALQKHNERLQLISEALATLLDAKEPAALVHDLLPRVARHLEADAFFNYMVVPEGGALALHAHGGIPAEAVGGLRRLAFGEAICGAVAQTSEPIHATDLGHSADDRTGFARRLGLQAYASHPFIVENQPVGTLAFATRARAEFQPDELEFMRSISRYVALALDRARAREKLQAHADELEQRVQERTASLRDAVTQMEEFSYSVSHDLRAPLRAMNGYAQVLVEDYGDRLDEAGRSYLERIQRSSVRMERLTHDVLTYSRIARAELPSAVIHPAAVVQDLITQYAELQPPRARVEMIGELLPVRGHDVSLGQCLANLLTNAAKFVAPGVTPHIRLRTERHEGLVRIWIEDNGIGIDPGHRERLFRVFERLPTRQAYDGTGIGLAIVRKAVEKMAGRCGVESDGVSGSRFWIELPAA